MVLEVCCAIPEGIRVTQALLLVATGAVKPVVSVIKHGKSVVFFSFRGTGDEGPIPSFPQRFAHWIWVREKRASRMWRYLLFFKEPPLAAPVMSSLM